MTHDFLNQPLLRVASYLSLTLYFNPEYNEKYGMYILIFPFKESKKHTIYQLFT